MTNVLTFPAKPSTEGQTLDGYIAARESLGSLKHGEAPRVGFLGDSGCGKTEAIRRCIECYLAMQPRGVVLIVDDSKPTPQFKGQLRRDRADLAARPPDPQPRVIVFRGNGVFGEGTLDPEEIARLQWDLARMGRPSLNVYDELDRAAVYGQWKAGGESSIAWAFGKGRSAGAASFWGTQETEAVPREAFNQTPYIFAFRMMGNPVRLLQKRGFADAEVARRIASLPGDELPPSRRGHFLLLRRGRPWDGHVYRFPPRGPHAR